MRLRGLYSKPNHYKGCQGILFFSKANGDGCKYAKFRALKGRVTLMQLKLMYHGEKAKIIFDKNPAEKYNDIRYSMFQN